MSWSTIEVSKQTISSKRLEIKSKLAEYEMKDAGHLAVETVKAEIRGFLQALDWMEGEDNHG
jgi:hypothetical protein